MIDVIKSPFTFGGLSTEGLMQLPKGGLRKNPLTGLKKSHDLLRYACVKEKVPSPQKNVVQSGDLRALRRNSGSSDHQKIEEELTEISSLGEGKKKNGKRETQVGTVTKCLVHVTDLLGRIEERGSMVAVVTAFRACRDPSDSR